MIRVLIADDNAVIRQGVRALLTAGADDIEVVGEASNGREGVDADHDYVAEADSIDLKRIAA